jgi:thioester reductase-like protein
MQDIYNYPTIRELSDRIRRVSKESDNNICKAKNIYNETNQKTHGNGFKYSIKEMRPIKKVFLTGATGFLGAHILNDLLSTTDADVYCLVRGKNTRESEKRLLNTLDFYFPGKYKNILEKRLFILSGDISQKNLGLPEESYKNLGNKIDIIIHTAALVKHYGNYSDFENINVFGTQRVVDFALEFRKPLSHISTISVSGEYISEQPAKRVKFNENDFFIGQNYMDNLYIRSKFEAENLIYKAVEQGLNATILRMGNLTGRYSDGHFQQNINENAFYNTLKSIQDLKVVSDEMLNWNLEFTPIDFCSKAIVIAAGISNLQGKTLHLNNHNTLRMKELIEIFDKFGIYVNILNRTQFKEYIREVSKNKEKRKLLSGIINYINSEGTLNDKNSIKISSENSINFLSKLSFEWPLIDKNYIKKVVDIWK